mmetsp:Transcript_5225/g.14899  ORF Transcript_5225/g.14899 Transcript_5225/m.14899 type:complete len:222 (-) Transcript_5225:72-737(-)
MHMRIHVRRCVCTPTGRYRLSRRGRSVGFLLGVLADHVLELALVRANHLSDATAPAVDLKGGHCRDLAVAHDALKLVNVHRHEQRAVAVRIHLLAELGELWLDPLAGLAPVRREIHHHGLAFVRLAHHDLPVLLRVELDHLGRCPVPLSLIVCNGLGRVLAGVAVLLFDLAHAVLAGGGGRRRLAGHPLAELVPARPEERERRPDGDAHRAEADDHGGEGS